MKEIATLDISITDESMRKFKAWCAEFEKTCHRLGELLEDIPQLEIEATNEEAQESEMRNPANGKSAIESEISAIPPQTQP